MTVDPRQARTSAALRAALVRLLSAQPLESITVSQLCREAGVHRTTFYKHADRVDAFAVGILAEEIDRLATVDDDVSSGERAARAYHSATRRLMAALVEHRDIYRALFASSAAGALNAALRHRIRERARIALDDVAAAGVMGAPRGERDQEEAAAYLAGGIAGLLEEWIHEDDIDVDAAEGRLFRLMPAWWPGVP
ncbi:TetR/AcrR family transcriptional regulator [Microbacterium sp. NPDC091382]|uniref:TetR/AcrR family transcriptional regulator n=1 Tax=Microbacterium sp. NPDC091382 TaxID=3364210 RepID=UPI00382368CB